MGPWSIFPENVPTNTQTLREALETWDDAVKHIKFPPSQKRRARFLLVLLSAVPARDAILLETIGSALAGLHSLCVVLTGSREWHGKQIGGFTLNGLQERE